MLFWDLFFLCQILGHRPRLTINRWMDGCHMQNPCPLVLSGSLLRTLPERMDGRIGAICKILAPWSWRGLFSERCQNGWKNTRTRKLCIGPCPQLFQLFKKGDLCSPRKSCNIRGAFEGMPGSSKRPASDPVSWVVSIGVGVISCPPGITNKSFAFY
jgi:hypothetical protein